jgi:hypothetical protein
MNVRRRYHTAMPPPTIVGGSQTSLLDALAEVWRLASDLYGEVTFASAKSPL